MAEQRSCQHSEVAGSVRYPQKTYDSVFSVSGSLDSPIGWAPGPGL